MNRPFAPPGWPAPVRAPGATGWERTAVEWLLDLCPPDWRGYDGLRRHPVVLARFASWHVSAGVQATARGLAETRTELGDLVSLDVVEAAVQLWLREDARLGGVRRAVDLVEQGLRGRRFRPRL